jgi:hypothetical protein
MHHHLSTICSPQMQLLTDDVIHNSPLTCKASAAGPRSERQLVGVQRAQP